MSEHSSSTAVDPEDGLSGLRTLAKRFRPNGPVLRNSKPEVPVLEPETAKAWLLGSGRMLEVEGELRCNPEESPSHLGWAALSIVKDGQPRDLYDAYDDLMDGRGALARAGIDQLAIKIVDEYSPRD